MGDVLGGISVDVGCGILVCALGGRQRIGAW